MIHTVGEDGEVTSKPVETDDDHPMSQLEKAEINLLDLYGQSWLFNPFLKIF